MYVSAHHYTARSPVQMHAALLERSVQYSLQSIQNLTYRLRKKFTSNDIQVCSQLVSGCLHQSGMDPSKGFYFGSQTVPGQSLGNGSRDSPLLVGVASMALLSLLQHLRTVGVLCIDFTSSLNNRAYPLIVVGITDADHSYHPVEFFAVSDEETGTYKSALCALPSIADDACGIDSPSCCNCPFAW